MMGRLTSIMFDGIIAASLYVGLTQNIDGLINIGYFIGWLFALTGISLLFTGSDKYAETYKHQSITWRTYKVLTHAAYVVFAAYMGWFVLASFYVIALTVREGIKSHIEKGLLKVKQESHTGNRTPTCC